MKVVPSFTNNFAMYAKLDDVLKIVTGLPGFEECIIETMCGKKVERLVTTQRKNNVFSSFLNSTAPTPQRVILCDNNVRPCGFFSGEQLRQDGRPCLIVVAGSNMELLGWDFVNKLTEDQPFFDKVRLFWGIPDTMTSLFKSFVKVVAESARADAAASQV